MDLEQLLDTLKHHPQQIDFAEIIQAIDTLYDFTPCQFRNGELLNEAGQNSGSCKLLAFGKLHGLDEQQTLHGFGQFYRAVLANPDGDDHRNIRNFIQTGWQEVEFSATPLCLREYS